MTTQTKRIIFIFCIQDTTRNTTVHTPITHPTSCPLRPSSIHNRKEVSISADERKLAVALSTIPGARMGIISSAYRSMWTCVYLMRRLCSPLVRNVIAVSVSGSGYCRMSLAELQCCGTSVGLSPIQLKRRVFAMSAVLVPVAFATSCHYSQQTQSCHWCHHFQPHRTHVMSLPVRS